MSILYPKTSRGVLWHNQSILKKSNELESWNFCICAFFDTNLINKFREDLCADLGHNNPFELF